MRGRGGRRRGAFPASWARDNVFVLERTRAWVPTAELLRCIRVGAKGAKIATAALQNAPPIPHAGKDWNLGLANGAATELALDIVRENCAHWRAGHNARPEAVLVFMDITSTGRSTAWTSWRSTGR